jgi:hypothetical protein
MFLYWQGYEIDGSDTDFDLVLPENRQLAEFVECFLDMPLFAQNPAPRIRVKAREITRAQLRSDLQRGKLTEPVTIMALCRHMEELPPALQSRIYALGEGREPREEAYGKTARPGTAPVMPQGLQHRGERVVRLTLGETKSESVQQDLKGYTHHPECFANENLPFFSLNLGPGFYYEYAIHIVEYLRERFPGLGTAGGLDCGGGWTEGCTYADSLYQYERIAQPVAYSVKNTLKRLTELDILRGYKESSWRYSLIDGFQLANPPKFSSRNFTLAQYAALVEQELEMEGEQEEFSAICHTALKITLPQPKVYAAHPEVEKRLMTVVPQQVDPDALSAFTGYFSFFRREGQIWQEFRIPWWMQDYFRVLMEMAGKGELDFHKAATYQRRHHDPG